MIEILSASKEYDESAIRAGIVAARPGFKIEAIVDNGDEWLVRISDGNPFAEVEDEEKPKKSEDKKDKAQKSESADSDDSEKSDDDDGESKGKKKDGPSVDDLHKLVSDLQATMDELVQKAQDVASDADDKQNKMEEIHDSVKEHVNKGDKGKGLLGDDEAMPAVVPEDSVGLEDVGPIPGGGAPSPGGPPSGPVGPSRPSMPGKKKGPGGPAGGGAPISPFSNVQVATHPGVNASGQKITMLAAGQALTSDPEFKDMEIVGITQNRDGSYSAKLQRK